MSVSENFVVDWPVTGACYPVRGVVAVRMQGRRVGLYRVKRAMRGSVVLSHGGISFPVGMELEIEDVRGNILPHLPKSVCARVVSSDRRGLSLAW